MREIKFRVWEIHNKQMSQNANLWQLLTAKLPISLNQHGQADERYCVVMQYTGLKDCNGKEICEGDILNAMVSKRRFTVFYENGAFQVRNNERETYTLHELLRRRKHAKFETEIIGNIYENPELLKP